MFMTTTTLFDDNDCMITFELKSHRKGLLKLVNVDWSSLDVEYIGPRANIAIIGVQALSGWRVGWSANSSSHIDRTIYTLEQNAYWGASGFNLETDCEVPYEQSRMFIVQGQIKVLARDNSSRRQVSKEVEITAQSPAPTSPLITVGAIGDSLKDFSIFGGYIQEGDRISVVDYQQNPPILVHKINEQEDVIVEETELPEISNFLGALPNGVKDEVIFTKEETLLIKRVGYTTTAASDNIQGTIGNDVISSTGVIEDGADVYYKIMGEMTYTFDGVELPIVVDGDSLEAAGGDLAFAPYVNGTWVTGIKSIVVDEYDQAESAAIRLSDNILYRQHGDTESWGSSNKKDLFFPWQNVRL